MTITEVDLVLALDEAERHGKQREYRRICRLLRKASQFKALELIRPQRSKEPTDAFRAAGRIRGNRG